MTALEQARAADRYAPPGLVSEIAHLIREDGILRFAGGMALAFVVMVAPAGLMLFAGVAMGGVA